MTKLEFLDALRKKLAGLPLEDIEKSIEYYKESIEDRMEDGLAEEEAVAALGDVEEIAKSILAETPLPHLVGETVKQERKLSTAKILLLVLGFPLWFPLLMSLASLVLSVFIALWSAVVSLFSLPVALGASALGILLGGAASLSMGEFAFSILSVGLCLILIALCIFSFLLCKLCAKGAAWCTKKLSLGIKRCFAKKEAE